MSVYIDSFRSPFGNMIMNHMIADTKEELLDMVDKIGVKRKWIQKEETIWEHFDICESKKILAIRHGAIQVETMELARKMVGKKKEKIHDI